MCASRIERHHDFGVGIAGIDLGDLHAHRRIGGPAAVPFELGDFLAAVEDGDYRRARDVGFRASIFDIAERRLHSSLRDLLSGRRCVLLPAAGLDLRRRVDGRDVGHGEIFGVDLVDSFGEAWCRSRTT
jgi:hypothetical protein